MKTKWCKLFLTWSLHTWFYAALKRSCDDSQRYGRSKPPVGYWKTLSLQSKNEISQMGLELTANAWMKGHKRALCNQNPQCYRGSILHWPHQRVEIWKSVGKLLTLFLSRNSLFERINMGMWKVLVVTALFMVTSNGEILIWMILQKHNLFDACLFFMCLTFYVLWP